MIVPGARDHFGEGTIVFNLLEFHLVTKLVGWQTGGFGRGRVVAPVWQAQGKKMRLVFRLLGTWLIGIALIFLVVDGTKSLAANAVVFTSLGQAWLQLHAPSLEGFNDFLSSRFFADLLDTVLQALLTYPAFAVLAVPGVVLALAGRRPRRERFLRQEQI